MKNLFFNRSARHAGIVFILSFNSLILAAQSDSFNGLPEKVVIAFRDHYPDVSNVSWSRDKNSFVAEYEMEGKQHQLWISDKGKFTRHSIFIKNEDLPESVKSCLTRKFPEYKIITIQKVDLNKRNFYQIRMRHDRVKEDFLIDESGKELSLIPVT